MENEEEPIRRPDEVRRERLIDHEDDLDEMIARLMSQGLTNDEAREIALSDIEENNRRMKTMTMENKVAELKAISESKSIHRKQGSDSAAEEFKSRQDNKIAELEKIVLDISRRLNAQHRKLVMDALAHYKIDKLPMEITDEEFASLNDELLKMTEIKRLNITTEIVNKLMDLFTTRLEEYEEYQYEDEDAEYGGSRRKRKNKTKTNKSKRSKRARKTKRSRKTKRATNKRYSKRRIYRK